VPREATAWVEIDGQTPVQGGFEGMLPPGVHQIRVSKPNEKAETLRIVVAAGKAQVVSQGEDGKLASDAPAPDSVVVDEAVADEGPRSGFFFHGGASLLLVGGTPPAYVDTKGGGGLGLQLRIGYRVNDWAAFEGSGQLSSVGGTGTLYTTERDIRAFTDAAYTQRSLRLAALFRVMAPGRSVVRFVGALGAGLSIDELVWVPGDAQKPEGPAEGSSVSPYSMGIADLPGSTVGVNAMGQLDLGIEFDIDNVIFGLTLQQILQGTGGLKAPDDNALYAKRAYYLLGPAIHIGYGLW
jgi:hypothetical protein